MPNVRLDLEHFSTRLTKLFRQQEQYQQGICGLARFLCEITLDDLARRFLKHGICEKENVDKEIEDKCAYF